MKSSSSKHVHKASEPDMGKEFRRLADEWREERGPSSSMTKFILHPAYQRIIGMGPAVLPLILRELREAPDHWFWALACITGENPVPQEHAGALKAMTRDWLNWAKDKGYVVEIPDRKALSKAG